MRRKSPKGRVLFISLVNNELRIIMDSDRGKQADQRKRKPLGQSLGFFPFKRQHFQVLNNLFGP